jgi:hypothetical protein
MNFQHFVAPPPQRRQQYFTTTQVLQDPLTGARVIRQTTHQMPQEEPSLAFLMPMPFMDLGGLGLFMNYDSNFRSGLNDDLLQQILRLSEQQTGRVGNPPASQRVIDKLPEVTHMEHYCKKDEKTGALEFPRCAVCCEDLKEKATLLPCGHLYDKECIGNWLKEHN